MTWFWASILIGDGLALAGSIVALVISSRAAKIGREAEGVADRAIRLAGRTIEDVQAESHHPWSEADREFFRQEAIRNADNPDYFAPQPPSMGRNWLAEEYRKNPW